MGDTIVVVVGAGVSGLTSALLLSKKSGYKITVIGKHMPGDYDGEYASPFAGANIIPMANEAGKHWESETWRELKRLAEQVPEAGIHFQRTPFLSSICRLNVLICFFFFYTKTPWYRDLFEDYHDLPQSLILEGYDSASEYTGVCINTAVYLSWLVGQLLKNGVVIKRGIICNIHEAKVLSHTGQPASVIINATGLGSLKLGGICDTALYPIRGQVAVVRNEAAPMVLCSGSIDGPGEELYLMQRAAGGGTVLGGTYEIGNWNSEPDPNVAVRIMSRVVNVRPEIADGKGIAGLNVIRHAVGLRPARKGGVRLEAEDLDESTAIVHNYGHGGYGYQTSYGYAGRVEQLVGEIRKRQMVAVSKL